MADQPPSEPPPSYQQAVNTTSSSRPTAGASSHLGVPGSAGASNAIPPAYRRSMEDEGRPLPKGWVRTFDAEQHHQFYVDTTKDPPRSCWTHPYDDPDYLSTLSSADRERIEQESLNRGHPHSKEDLIAAHSDEDEDETSGELPPRPEGKGKGKDDRGFGRKFKDKLTGTTHQEREQMRKKRAEEEARMYEQHTRMRRAMAEAARTGKPQLVGKDSDGKDLYIEAPAQIGGGGGGMYAGGMYAGSGYGGGRGGRYPGQYIDPYRGGVYTTPDARYIRPPNPYSRPGGMGYGGGYGLPLAMGGGLVGGMMLGGMMGGMGGGGL